MWFRFVIIGFFALTAFSLFSFQAIEIVHAFMNFIHDKHQLK